MNKITELFKPKTCIHRHTIRTHRNCFDANGNPLLKEATVPASLLVIDIETLPILGYFWNVWNQNIYQAMIKKDWCILSYSAKWLGDERIISDTLTTKEAIIRDDKRIVTGIWKLLEKSDVIITHNGKRFDVRKINTRFWKNGLHKPSSYKIIDTLIAARSVFGLTYNSMEFIAKFIEADEKLDTEFPLWAACDRGDKNALLEMKEYNEQDVITQEQIYMSMREWIPNHPDLGVYQNLENVCPVCLGTNFKEIGLYTASRLQYKEYRCEDCGNVWHNSKAVKEQN
jgi:hypothetical protein